MICIGVWVFEGCFVKDVLGELEISSNLAELLMHLLFADCPFGIKRGLVPINDIDIQSANIRLFIKRSKAISQSFSGNHSAW